jgi:hypothetical protein
VSCGHRPFLQFPNSPIASGVGRAVFGDSETSARVRLNNEVHQKTTKIIENYGIQEDRLTANNKEKMRENEKANGCKHVTNLLHEDNL